jgi:hypothetical protein
MARSVATARLPSLPNHEDLISNPTRSGVQAPGRGDTVRHAALIWHGPAGTVCGQCSLYGYGRQYPDSCYRYLEVFSQHGDAFPAETPSCKYFALRCPDRNEILRL